MTSNETGRAMLQPNETRSGRILPRDAGTASLDIVIGVMALLATLALGGTMIAERSAQTWQAGLAGRLTVQILPEGENTHDEETDAALKVLGATQGVAQVNLLSDSENLALVEPWLGDDAAIADLPFPHLIDVALEPGSVIDVAALEKNLKDAAPHALLDDHSRWVGSLKSAASTVAWGAMSILVLIAVATAASVTFATRAGLAAHHDVVELLHLMGAHDRFISGAFEWHYFFSALFAATCGALAAAAVFLAAGGLAQVGITSVSFLPPLGLRLEELPWLLAIPMASALISWATARLSVMSALREFY